MDKTVTNAFFDFMIDEESRLPKRIRITVLTGRRGATEKEGARITGGEHVVFRFSYKFAGFGDVKSIDVPAAARKLLSKR